MRTKHTLLLSGGLDSTYLLFKLLLEDLNFKDKKDFLELCIINSSNFQNCRRQFDAINRLITLIYRHYTEEDISFQFIDFSVLLQGTSYASFPGQVGNIKTNGLAKEQGFRFHGLSQTPMLIAACVYSIHVETDNVIHIGYTKNDLMDRGYDPILLADIDTAVRSFIPFISLDKYPSLQIEYDLIDTTKREIVLKLINLLMESNLEEYEVDQILRNIVYCEKPYVEAECACPSCKKMKEVFSGIERDSSIDNRIKEKMNLLRYSNEFSLTEIEN